MKINLKKIATVAVATVTSFPLLAAAQFTTTAPPPITTVTQVYNLTVRILGYLQTFFWVVAAIMIVWAAFLYVTGGGNEDKIAKAKQMLIYAVLAIIVALVATAVVGAVRSFIG